MYPTLKSLDMQAIYQDSPESSEVGAVGRRTKDKGKVRGMQTRSA